jgi:hypothetical protein
MFSSVMRAVCYNEGSGEEVECGTTNEDSTKRLKYELRSNGFRTQRLRR